MFSITLYQFSKRENSTKRPSGTGRTFNNVLLKSGCSIIAPTIEFNIGNTESPERYNFAYIQEFDRYYFIEDWTFNNGIWYADMKCDVLATYRPYIADYNGYVLRSASEYNGNVIDTLYPALASVTDISNSFTNPLLKNQNDGCYVLGIQCKADVTFKSAGSMTYYVFSYAEMQRLMRILLDDTFLASDIVGLVTGDASVGLQKNIINPLDYIKSAFYLPVSYDSIGLTYTTNATAPLVFDWLMSNVQTSTGTQSVLAKPLNKQLYYEISMSVDVPKHPQASTRGNYCNSSRYASYELSIAPLGIIKIPNEEIIDSEYLTLNLKIDLIDGQGLLNIYDDGGDLVTQTKGQVMIPIQLAQISRDVTSGLTRSWALSQPSAVGRVVGSAVSNAIGGVVGIQSSLLESQKANVKTSGSNGGYVDLTMDNKLYGTFTNLVAEDNTNHGRPLMAMRRLGNLSGYMVVQDGDVPLDSTQTEAQEVKRYLENGFYFE